MNGHIRGLVKLVDETNANYFAKSPIESYPTILTINDESFSTQVFVENVDEIKPGAVLEVAFRFLVPEIALKQIVVGAEFSIWEEKLVGKGSVIELLLAE